MLYLLSNFRETFSALNIFQYITFRSGGAFLTSLGIMLVFGGPFIELLKTLKVAQSIREYGPSTHLAKAGTPTMGGLLILFAIVSSTLLWARLNNRFIWVILITAVWLGTLGFLDDYRKWLTKHPAGGISEKLKLFAQIFLALSVATYFYLFP